MKEKLYNFKEIIKKIFLVSVLILVIIQFKKISKDIKVEDIKFIFKNFSISTMDFGVVVRN